MCGHSTPFLLALPRYGVTLESHVKLLLYFVWLRISDEGSIPETRILSVPILKWCINLSRHIIFVFLLSQNVFLFKKTKTDYFVAPPLILGTVLLYLRSPKGGCCSISDDLYCSDCTSKNSFFLNYSNVTFDLGWSRSGCLTGVECWLYFCNLSWRQSECLYHCYFVVT